MRRGGVLFLPLSLFGFTAEMYIHEVEWVYVFHIKDRRELKNPSDKLPRFFPLYRLEYHNILYIKKPFVI